MTQTTSTVPQSAFARIRAAYPQLSAKEQQVADYILNHPEEIIHLSITELSDQCNCAEATIFRLCRRLGFRGYQALKISLASEVVQPLTTIHQEISPDDDVMLLAEKIFTANVETLRDTLQIVNRDALAEVVEILVNARKIEFYGCGGSAVIAQDAYHKFMRTGIPCAYFADPHYQAASAALLAPGDVAVGISHSGSNKDVLEALKVAKEAGARVIGITGYGKSPLVKLADACLFSASRETVFRTEALSSRLAQLSLIDLLYVAVSLKRQDETVENIQKIRQAISLKRL